MRRIACVLALAALAACGDDGDRVQDDPGCVIWIDLLAGDPAGLSDPEAAEAARQVAAATELDDVRSFATALAARLEDGTDLGDTFTRLSDACGLGGP